MIPTDDTLIIFGQSNDDYKYSPYSDYAGISLKSSMHYRIICKWDDMYHVLKKLMSRLLKILKPLTEFRLSGTCLRNNISADSCTYTSPKCAPYPQGLLRQREQSWSCKGLSTPSAQETGRAYWNQVPMWSKYSMYNCHLQFLTIHPVCTVLKC